jgi:hypothetical protein
MVPVLRRLLAWAGTSRPPQPVLMARHRRCCSDQQLAVRVVELGFTALRGYLADRVVVGAAAASCWGVLGLMRARCGIGCSSSASIVTNAAAEMPRALLGDCDEEAHRAANT